MTARLATISIVSHGHGPFIAPLLDDLEAYCGSPIEVIVVLNAPEDEGYLRARRRFKVTVIRNGRPAGFGANHNKAFAHSAGQFFVVANPDIRLVSDPFPRLLAGLRDHRVGVCAPTVLSSSGAVEDSARRFPTVAGLLARRLPWRARTLDYSLSANAVSVDWVAGIMMAFRRDVYASLSGFDERYYMYFEDVDLCARVHAAGLDVAVDPAAQVIHDARRESHRDWRHAYWHVSSARLFLWRRWVGRLTGARRYEIA